jgi:hypothetical protein
MLTKLEFRKLIMSHGSVTYFTIREGGEWIEHKHHESQYLSPHFNSMQAMHSLRFKDGNEWDEINGIRKLIKGLDGAE